MSVVDTRNISRDSLFLLAEIRPDGSASEFRVKVRNLSAGGMLAEGFVPVVPGIRLKIFLRNIGWVDGCVAWVQENRFGIAFDREINPKLVRAPQGSDQSVSEQFVSDAHRQFVRLHSTKFSNDSRKSGKLHKV